MNWPPDLTQVVPYLRRADVVNALHINSDNKKGWAECNNQVGAAFTARNSRPSIELLPGLLEKVPIVLFSGDKDMICNHLGTENLINGLSWNGGTGMELSPGVWAPRRDWRFDGEPAGIYQHARNLTYVVFYNSSHMVPFDYPRRARDMLDRFMGVDVGAVGGVPVDSTIDGEKASTGVGGGKNSTAANEEAEKERLLQEATWRAYYQSGEVALVVVAIAAAVWGVFVYRQRRRHRGYKGLFGADTDEGDEGDMGLGGRVNGFRRKGARDVEAADFDEAELDDLGASRGVREQEQFDLGEDSGSEGEGVADGHGHGHK